MPAAAVPIGSALIAPTLAEGATAALGGTALAGLAAEAPWLVPAVVGAGLGGVGSLLTGQDPLKGALFGGVGGGIGSQINAGNGLSGLFGGGNQVSADLANEAISPALASADKTLTNPQTSTGLFGSGIGKMLPYAAVAGGAALLDKNMAPENVGPPMQKHPESGQVNPLQREYKDVDPSSYFTSGGNRNFYTPYSMTPKYYADGGEVDGPRQKSMEYAMKQRARINDAPMAKTADFVIERYRNSDYPGTFSEYMQQEYGDVPISRVMRKKFANGGSSSASSSNIPMGIGRMVKGKGDGQSDDIPAMLSDGEFVFSAPAVSAIGNGSNDAGARKLAAMQKSIIGKHYKGGKPRKSVGLGSYH